MSKANTQVVTRSRTGSLVPSRIERLESGSSPAIPTAASIVKQEIGSASTGPTRIATADEIKQQMEQNLRMQRAAHNQRRSLDPSGKPNILKIQPPTAGKNFTTLNSSK
jgi:nucleosome-remodeling factor subunit BPTF